jgi:hypothetical protein
MEQRAVFGDDPIEKIQLREVLSQVIEFPARHHNQPPARTAQPFERRHSLVIHPPVMSQRAVVITCQSVITHALILRIVVGEFLLTGSDVIGRDFFQSEYS